MLPSSPAAALALFYALALSLFLSGCVLSQGIYVCLAVVLTPCAATTESGMRLRPDNHDNAAALRAQQRVFITRIPERWCVCVFTCV